MYTDDYRPNAPQPKMFGGMNAGIAVENAGRASAGSQAQQPPPEMVRRTVSRSGDLDLQPLVPKPDVRSDANVQDLPKSESSLQDAAEGGNESEGERRMRITIGLLSLAGWAAVLLALLWLFSLSSPFLQNALELQGWRAWASLALGILPFAGAACLALYLLVSFRKLPKVEQVKMTSSSTNARLKEFLKTRYLSKIANVDRYVKENGFAGEGKSERAKQVSDCLKRLRGDVDGRYSDATGWMMDFRRFQTFQDELADEAIARTWKQVGLLTAASPWKLGDRLVVAYHSAIMIVRISRLYNRQVSGLVAFRLACRWLVDIYVAGELGELTANAIPSIIASFPLLGSLLGKSAEGGVNAVLVINLGRKAKNYFRPLADGKR